MNRGRTIRTAAAATVLLVLAGCCGGNRETEKGLEKAMSTWHIDPDCSFEGAEFDLMERNSCSPVIDDVDFEGIVIHAPEEVLYEPGEPVEGSEAFADVRICGTCCVDYAFGGLGGDVIEEILLVAVDAATQETYSGKMEPIPNPEERPDDLGGGPVDTEGLLVETYFNPNLAEDLALPERPAEYIVYAVLGEYKSNTVRIRVKERG